MDLIELLRWVAFATGVVAAILVALRLSPRTTGVGFAIFCICSIAWVAVGLADDELKLAGQNAVLLAVNIFGVWRWLIRN